MLRPAFNALTKIHSKPAYIKRVGTPDIYSPCNLSPSNFFRFLKGPEFTTVHGREFVIPESSMLGENKQTISFDPAPTTGQFKLHYATHSTGNLNYDAIASVIQIALRGITDLSDVTVSGTSATSISVVLHGIQIPTLLSIIDSSLADDNNDASVPIIVVNYQKWTQRLRRGDKILSSLYGQLTIDEIIEMVDIGGDILGFRIRCE